MRLAEHETVWPTLDSPLEELSAQLAYRLKNRAVIEDTRTVVKTRVADEQRETEAQRVAEEQREAEA